MTPQAALTSTALLLLALCVARCVADVDPDSDPDRAPRLRPALPATPAPPPPPPPGGEYSYYDGSDQYPGLSGYLFADFTLPPIQTLGCLGGSAIAFTIDASSSIVPVEFSEMQSELETFIIETDDPSVEKRNLYYANTFGTVLEETTAAVAPGSPNFDPNADDAVSDAIRAFSPSRGAGNIAAGLSDLAAQFADLSDPAYAGIAVLVTDSTASPAGPLVGAVTALKTATRARLGIDVTVVVVGVGSFVDVEEMRLIASEDGAGVDLVLQVDFFDDISRALEEALERTDSDGDGVNDCLDGCPADPRKTEPGRCGCGIPEEECPSECRGLFGFSLNTNACFGSDAFSDVLGQVISFVDATSGFASGPANPNLYYANAVHHRVHSSTGLFDRNTDGDIAAAIANDISFIPGGVDIAAGLVDLRGRFGAGQLSTVTFARFAVVVTDGFDDPGEVAAAAAALKEDDVTMIVVAPEGLNDMTNLEAIAGAPDLVLTVSSFDGISELLLSTIAQIGVTLMLWFSMPAASTRLRSLFLAFLALLTPT